MKWHALSGVALATTRADGRKIIVNVMHEVFTRTWMVMAIEARGGVDPLEGHAHKLLAERLELPTAMRLARRYAKLWKANAFKEEIEPCPCTEIEPMQQGV